MTKRYGPELIREIKRRSDITQQKLADLLGITQQAVSDYARGKVQKERYDIIRKLEEILSNAIIEYVQRESKKLPRGKEAKIESALIKEQHGKKNNAQNSES